MKKKNNIKTFLVAVTTCVSIVVFGVALRYSFFYAPSGEITLASGELQPNANGNYPASLYPAHLRIPSIKVDSKIIDVGITSKGNMATPSNFTDVGWFKYGTSPGETGSAVMAGHVNDGINFPAVFANLNNVKVGDDVYVDTIGGSPIHFVVTNIQTYDFNAPTEAIFNQNNGKFLKLITCAGVWMDQYKTHDKRLVVTAELI